MMSLVINVHRMKEASALNTNTVGSSCPFCLTMVRDGLAELNKEEIQSLDIAEIVAKAL